MDKLDGSDKPHHTFDDFREIGSIFYGEEMDGLFSIAKDDLIERITAYNIPLERINLIFPELELETTLVIPKTEIIQRLRSIGILYEEDLVLLFADVMMDEEGQIQFKQRMTERLDFIRYRVKQVFRP